MVSRLLYGNWVDEYIEKATAETIPRGQEDYGTCLEICDQIRSKQMPAKDAAKALRRRIGHRNPNVQLLALSLTDMVVKNGGAPFLIELASREFMDDLVSLLHAPQSLHHEVQRLLLTLIQRWAVLLRGKPEYAYPDQVYNRLKAEGFSFPPLENTGQALIETSTAPEWTDSDVCMRCRTAFTFTNRKHHCRSCGQTFCQTCSSNTMSLPHFGINEPVRVCHGCYLKLKKVVHSVNPYPVSHHDAVPPPSYSISKSHSSHKSAGTASQSHPVANAEEGEDDDIKRAIELSLKEAQNNPRNYALPATSTAFPMTSKHPSDSDHVKVVGAKDHASEEPEDPELAAAIAASLQQMKVDESRHRSYVEYTGTLATTAPALTTNSSFLSTQGLTGSANDDEVSAVQNSLIQQRPHELSVLEKENIQLFSTLLERMQSDAASRGDMPNIHTHPQLPYLYTQITRLQPKLARNLSDIINTHEQLLALHSKIGQAVKKYDHLLDQRIQYARQGLTATPGGSGYPPVSVAPYEGYLNQASYPASSTGTTGSGRYNPTPVHVPSVPPVSGVPTGTFQPPPPPVTEVPLPRDTQAMPVPTFDYSGVASSGSYSQHPPSGMTPSVNQVPVASAHLPLGVPSAYPPTDPIPASSGLPGQQLPPQQQYPPPPTSATTQPLAYPAPPPPPHQPLMPTHPTVASSSGTTPVTLPSQPTPAVVEEKPLIEL
ncbi:Vacuolar protein-sorting-associated protein 27 [Dispira parvispora]|uniref:Vacuolar protein sorting-associated protein 27 n=1 Tax=Dispira parvispora TaxID=1520584 RepID=A0A9W8AVX9_9FUNG|nr:Vacuolar protein-sorting-associated protein 27 [Dispira parvispora]